MKIAFICEGHSEHDALPILVPKIGLTGYDFLRRPEDVPQNGNVGIYRINNKSVSGVLKMVVGEDGVKRRNFIVDALYLIFHRSFDKIFVWFDNEDYGPVCDHARLLRQEIVDLVGDEVSQKIILVIAANKLENWYFSSKATFLDLFELKEELLAEECANLFSLEDVDAAGVGSCLDAIDAFFARSKKNVAMDFFTKFNPDSELKSHSFNRAIAKLRSAFN
jgi:hypothetical protein